MSWLVLAIVAVLSLPILGIALFLLWSLVEAFLNHMRDGDSWR
jgi:hypothetical protein